MNDGKAMAITERCDALADVDTCLSALYDRALVRERAVPTVKALLLNLIVYASDEALAEEAMERASRVLPLLPCRAIIAETASSMPSEGAQVSVMCGISERGDRRLCGEVINVHALRGSVTGAVMPLLLPDVPVCLWVLGDIPAQREDFSDLLRVSTHLIVDSRKFADLSRGVKSMQRLQASDGDTHVLQDLAWVSLRSWREATAGHFDAPSLRSYLARLQNVDITYSGSTSSPYPESAPLFFTAWLAERTQLQIESVFHSRDEGFVIAARQEGRDVTVHVRPVESHRPAGELLSVSIECASGDERAVFTTQRASDTELAMTEECAMVCLPPKNVPAPSEDDASLAVQALKDYGRDLVFDRVMPVVLKIMAQVELTEESASGLRL